MLLELGDGKIQIITGIIDNSNKKFITFIERSKLDLENIPPNKPFKPEILDFQKLSEDAEITFLYDDEESIDTVLSGLESTFEKFTEGKRVQIHKELCLKFKTRVSLNIVINSFIEVKKLFQTSVIYLKHLDEFDIEVGREQLSQKRAVIFRDLIHGKQIAISLNNDEMVDQYIERFKLRLATFEREYHMVLGMYSIVFQSKTAMKKAIDKFEQLLTM